MSQKIICCLAIIVSMQVIVCGQAYTSYVLGDAGDITTSPIAGTVLMGGATENDNAIRWFLNRADGGDILVLRTTGDDAYNPYFYADLGVTVNSVETIVCNTAAASSDPYVIAQIQNAEALWFAGGDQWDYISFWKDTPVEDAINYLINEKHVPIGGTSAGCAIQGDAYFSAENGTVTSAQALSAPYSNLMMLGYHDFIDNPATQNIITDTHYDNPDRQGRHLAFLARLYTDYGTPFLGIASEEYTAVCIDENNIAHAYGSYPDYDDFVYFLQVNCEEPNAPETCALGEHVTWNRENAALKVVKMGADDNGSGFFDLNNWKNAGGEDFTWQNWWADDGVFEVLEDASAVDCDTSTTAILNNNSQFSVYPNPADDLLTIHFGNSENESIITVYAITGDLILQKNSIGANADLDFSSLPSALYIIEMVTGSRTEVIRVMKR